MLIRISIQGLILGAVSGSIWSFMLHENLTDGLLYGSIAGFTVAILLYLFQRTILLSGLVHRKEMTIASLTFIGYVFSVVTLVGVCAGILKWIFV
ncbi:MAG: hypothetical protein V4613_05230 [Bacteroidota bacterium]